MKVRTRYAPSPTGYFHIGGARTALFNYLYAKHHQGDFVVRIEDTDTERNVDGGIQSQLENIAWMQITPDESPLCGGEFGPYQQTQKLSRYQQLAQQLVQEKKAYYCFCTKEELDEQRKIAETNHQTPKYNRHCFHLKPDEIKIKLAQKIPYTIRLVIDESINYEWDDLIRGRISVPGSAMTDPVILKSNGIAMYNFAVVIDDYDMQITHILRGEEHISNTPYQIAIKNALGFDNQQIRYGHLSIIVNDKGKKLSKRDLNLKQFIEDYRKLGYLPSAIVNFLALLGWSSSDNQEVMQLSQLINSFKIDNLSKSPARFDETKLQWVSNQHFKLLDNNSYLSFVKPFITSKNKIYLEHQEDVLLLFKPQISFACEINDLIDDIFNVSENLDEHTNNEINNHLQNIKLIQTIIKEELEKIRNEFNIETIKNLIESIKQKTNLKGKDLFMPIRILCTNKSHGPELAKIIYLFGYDNVLKNITRISKMVG